MSDEERLPESDQVAGHPHPREAMGLFGQDLAAKQFLDVWQGGRLHHAWLLRGPKGIGKATLAYRIARAVLAQPAADAGLFGDGPEIPATLDIPENCPTFARIAAQSEPRLFVLRRQWDLDKKRFQTQISIDHVRGLRRFLQLSSADGGWRVVIVDPADEMNRNSANALLKYLEEPPADTLFLLLSHAPAGLLPTIRSRCRTLDLSPLSPAALASALKAAGVEVSPGKEIALGELSGGSAGQALDLLSGDGLEIYGMLVEAPRQGRGVDRPGMLYLAGKVAGTAGAPRYRATCSLTLLLLSRLARAAAMGPSRNEAAPGEHALMDSVAQNPDHARLWAETLGKLSMTLRHATSVNLDPQQCVIDMLLEVDAALSRARMMPA